MRILPFKYDLKRAAILSLEIIGGLTALIAFYEIFLSRKYVDHIAHEIDLCAVSSKDETTLEFSRDIENHADDFVYVKFKYLSYGYEIGNDCEGDPSRNIFLDQSDGNYVLILPPSHYLDIIERRTAFVTLKIHFDPDEIEKSVLAQFHIDPFEESLSIEGLFFVDFDAIGEAGSNYYFIPAPYGIRTQEISACTRSLIDAQYPGKIWTYVSNCILN